MKSKLVALQLAAIAMVLVLSSCGGSGASQVLNSFPDGDYFILMGFDTTELLSSSAFDSMMEMMSEVGQGPEDYFESMSEQWEGSSIDWTRLDTALVMMSEDPREMITYLRSGEIEVEKVIDYIEDEWGGDIEEKEEGGLRYWWDDTSESGIIEIEGGIFMAAGEAIENTIEVRTAGGKKLVDDSSFRDALSLTDVNSTVYITVWGGLEKYTGGIKEALIIIEDDEEVIEQFNDAMDDLEASGVAIWFDDGFEISGKVLFADEDSATFAEKYVRETLEKLQERVADRRKFFRYIAPNIDPSLPEQMLDRITIGRSGPVVEARIDINEMDPLIELAKAGLEANRKHKATERAIENIGYALMSYGFDHDFYPRVDSIEELLAILTKDSFYISERTTGVDGWGFPLIYEYGESVTGERSFTVASYGADGKPGPDVADKDGLQDVTRYVEDYIYSDGSWTQKPKY